MIPAVAYFLGILLGERQKIRNWSYCARWSLRQQIWPLNKRRKNEDFIYGNNQN